MNLDSFYEDKIKEYNTLKGSGVALEEKLLSSKGEFHRI